MGFYEKFLRLCEERGIPKQNACKAAGLSGNAWIRWASGSKPGAVSISKICSYFGVSVDSMVDDSVDKPIASNSYASRQEVFDRPEMRILFDAAKDAPSSAILEAALKLMKFKEDNMD